LEFLGRLDHQVKIRGFRVEPGEVEAVLRRDPAVRECAVVAREDVPGDRRLVAYVVGEGDAEAHRERLGRMLPDYLVPSAFVRLDGLPLTPNGKLDRRSLPTPAYAAPRERYVAPRTVTEAALAEIWAEVLGVERVGVHDGFFVLGGHSLSAMRVIARVQSVFGVWIPIRDLFRGPTVAQAAERIEALQTAAMPASYADSPAALTDADLDAALAVPGEVEDLYPLAPLQEEILERELSGSAAQTYHMQTVQRIEGPLDAGLLRRVWSEVVNRHPFLRTSFVWEGLPRPLQRVAAAVGPEWRMEDWRALPPAEQDAALESFLAEDRARGFVLDAPPLLRHALFRVGYEAYWFVWSKHQLVLDGWSAVRVRSEVYALYRARAAGQALELETLPPYRDYITWIAEQDEGEAERYWRGALAGFRAPTPLAADRPPGASAGEQYAERVLRLPRHETRRVEEAARRMQVTVNTLLQGAWALLLARRAGSDDVLFGNTGWGRPVSLPGAQEMVGHFNNTLPLRVRVPGDARLRAWLAQLQRDGGRMGDFEHVSLSKIRRWSGLPDGAPLFESIFMFENYPAGNFAAASGSSALRLEPPRVIYWAPYALTLVVWSGTSFDMVLKYDESRFDAATAGGILGELADLLGQISSGPDVPLADLTAV
ncbi:MAG: non-ribosomal peptide synthetase, partial [Gemmatimonadetes bacterium]|nr:non-ribosomal peptide synthetase [Gemmatimonadota bacterium]